MTFHNISRIATLSVLALGFTAFGLAEENADSVAFLEGTAIDIPAKTSGHLDLEDSQNLLFHFGDTDVAIPYDQITSYKWGKEYSNSLGGQFSGSAHKVGRTLMPMFFSKDKFLTLYYRDDASAKTEQAVFAVPKQIVSAADPILDAWVDRNNAIPHAEVDIPAAETWWGNRYWKTNKNAHLWESARKSTRQDAESVDVATRDE